MVRRIEFLIGQIIAGGARPAWTLLAVSCLLSGALVVALRP
jgi:hypothetical protein